MTSSKLKWPFRDRQGNPKLPLKGDWAAFTPEFPPKVNWAAFTPKLPPKGDWAAFTPELPPEVTWVMFFLDVASGCQGDIAD